MKGIVLLLLFAAAANRAPAPTPVPSRDRGMGYAHSLRPNQGYGSAASAESLRRLRLLGFDSISLTPFGFQRSENDTTIIWVGNRGGRIGETDDAIRAGARQSRALGLRVMLKPHIWLRPPGWPGSIEPSSAAGWNAWFDSYGKFILHYARLAEEIHAETFCVGNELVIASSHEKAWRKIIAGTRQVYRGRLTYGANFTEVFDVPFWDALDAIGVSAYFPLSDEATPAAATLVKAWQPIVARLGRLSSRWKRPILFTEVGYSSRDRAAKHPWEEHGGSLNLKAQTAAYEAFFQAVWPQAWVAGVYFWKWESYPDHDDGSDIAFTIEHKPAAEVVRKHFQPARRNGH